MQKMYVVGWRRNNMRSYEKSKAAFKEAVDLMPGGVNSPVRAFKSVNMDPIFMHSGKGAILTDIDGNVTNDIFIAGSVITLEHGMSYEIKNIDAGTKYEVTEAKDNGYTTKYEVIDRIGKDTVRLKAGNRKGSC